jgi:uncharacterized membrane protein SpoIIM required for sporulation
VIIDLKRFIAAEEPRWNEFDTLLRTFEEAGSTPSLDDLDRFHKLYRRTGSDLMKIKTYARDEGIVEHLESLIARGYAVLHKKGARGTAWQPLDWFWRGFPAAFRRQVVFFWTAVLLTLLGAAFGAGLVAVDPDHKNDLIPEQFAGHRGDPSERVAREEAGGDERLGEVHASFASQLMTHNIQVGLAILALGFTFGVGTVVLLFYNGVILGVIAYDYVLAGQTRFLLAWLLPHGVVELPAIFIAGQAGLLIASASLGWRDGRPWSERLRAVRGDLASLAGGMAVMLVWAGIVESFLSQYHEPVLPYSVKIGFGFVELLLLTLFLGLPRRPAVPAPARST